MPENQLTPGFDPSSIIKSEAAHVRAFLEALCDIGDAKQAAAKAGISPELGAALLNQPAFRAALDLELESRFTTQIVPKALNAIAEQLAPDVDRALQGLEPVPAGVKGRVALGALDHARKLAEAGAGGAGRPLSRMTPAELEARAAVLRAEEDRLSGVIAAEYQEISPIKET